MAGDAGRRAAWDAYQAVTERLLPALRDREDDEVINPRLGAVVIRIRRYAPMWPADGPMLIAAAADAVRLLRAGDRAELTALSVAMAHRLFALSAGPDRLHHPGRRNQKPAWDKRFEPGNQTSLGWRRNTRHRIQQHEKGSPDD